MTSDCAGDQVSHGPDGPTSVKAASAIGGHDRLTEAPLICPRCDGTDTEPTGDPGGILCWRCGRMFLRDGRPG
jgi:hypothetical protein